jgi:hypothetical protein
MQSITGLGQMIALGNICLSIRSGCLRGLFVTVLCMRLLVIL